jgi:type IV conjugative transfer system coupling protein TraD
MTFSNIIRGGQVQIHQFRMAKQIFGIAFMLSLLLGTIVVGWNLNKNSYKFDYCASSAYVKSLLVIKILPSSLNKNIKVSLCGRTDQHPSFFINNAYVNRKINFLLNSLTEFAFYGAVSALGFFLVIIFLWMKLGNMKSNSDEEKGIYSDEQLKKYLKNHDLLSEFSIDNLPLVRNKETAHMLFAGMSGTGKSTAIKNLLNQVRQKSQNAIIVDLTGDYVNLFYNPETDFILNPTDDRSAYWNLWEETSTKESLSVVTSALFSGDNATADKFWSESAKLVFENAITNTDVRDYQKLYQLLAITDLDKLHEELNGTASASLISPKNDKTAFSIRSTLVTYTDWLTYLKPQNEHQENFSIKNWMSKIDQEQSCSWLFLTAAPNQRKLLEPLLRIWMDVALSNLMNLQPSRERRVWFVMDEMPALGKLPSLSTMLAESRKYGGCVVSGIQSISQLYEIYGHHGANSTIDGFATKIFFRVAGIENSAKISKLFGTKEKEEINENITYGSHEMRDGVSISRQSRNKLIVTEKDISSIPDLEAYALMPCEMSVVKTRFRLH